MNDRRGARSAVRIVATILLCSVAAMSWTRGHVPNADYKYFYLDARFVWEHAALNPVLDEPGDTLTERQLPFYLPTVPVVLSLWAAGGASVARLLWAAAQVAALAVVLRVLKRWSEPSDHAMLITLVLASPVILEVAHFNQISLFVLALILAAAAALERHRPIRAGALLGAAAVLKIVPVLLALWLAVRREWTALAALVVTTIVLMIAPPLIRFGPPQTLEYHAQWAHYNLAAQHERASASVAARPHFLDYHNESIPAVIGRVFMANHPYRVGPAIVTWSASSVRMLGNGFMLLVLGIGIVAAYRNRAFEFAAPDGAGHAGRTRLPAHEACAATRWGVALFLLVLLLISPLLRTYYLVWALPALVLLSRAALAERPHGAARFALPAWLLGLVFWPSHTARAFGLHAFVLIVLLAALVSISCAKRSIRGRTPPSGASPDP